MISDNSNQKLALSFKINIYSFELKTPSIFTTQCQCHVWCLKISLLKQLRQASIDLNSINIVQTLPFWHVQKAQKIFASTVGNQISSKKAMFKKRICFISQNSFAEFLGNKMLTHSKIPNCVFFFRGEGTSFISMDFRNVELWTT